ncbi:hypothetical protein ACH4E7_44970 [Kitasatospora sp. NPDC018058]|uniref:hypothetical protein n=1 Tax=Kitasatospora sp. NPDC018058 TaxID=3364025 RepID=UPI0037BE6B3B
MGTFDHKVVEAFIQTMERNGIGMATQTNVFISLKTILLDAHRLGLYEDSPLDGVKAPQYDPERAVIPSVAQLQQIRTAGDDAFRLVTDLMSGCGLRTAKRTRSTSTTSSPTTSTVSPSRSTRPPRPTPA